MEVNKEKLAKSIANDIFKLGSEMGSACTRIQFMAKNKNGNEIGQGGLCDTAFELVLLASLKKHLAITT